MDSLAAYSYVADFYSHNAPSLRFYARQKLCSVAATLYCECARTDNKNQEEFLQRFVEEFRDVRREYGLRRILSHGSANRRMMLILFEVSPQLCAFIYRWKRG